MKLSLQKLSLYLLTGFCFCLDTGCTEGNTQVKIPQLAVQSAAAVTPSPAPIVSNAKAAAATILARPEVPILCYHQIRDYKSTDGKIGKPYIVPVAVFRDQMQALADSGYHTILPDQLVDYLESGKQLPQNPVMITFDDTRLDQYTAALPALDKHGFKAAFFIMTVSLGRPGYMSKDQVKALASQGHTIGSHTWDHKNVKKYTDEDWSVQVEKPSSQLQLITGKPVKYFAYPFGLWNKQAIAGLRKFNFKGVFQLADARDEQDPMYSIRRIIVPGSWNGKAMLKSMQNSF
jgi:peptidoglycan/xylan/chitin deacetylase (PgdA/CDA1 family)